MNLRFTNLKVSAN